MQTKTPRILRSVALFLLCVTVCTAILVACSRSGGNETPQNTTSSGHFGNETSTAEMIRQKYANAGLSGDFTILGIESGTWWYTNFMSESFNEIWYETTSPEPLENSIYTRNRYTEDLLGISIKPRWTDSAYANAAALRIALETDDTDFDLVLTSLYDGLVVAQEGHCANLLEIDTLDLSNPWWDQNLVESFTMFNDRFYTLSGYANVYDDMAVNMFMFNKDLIETLGLENPYTLVHQNQWTIDRQAQMAKKATMVNGQGDMGEGASWGLWIGSGAGIPFSGFDKPVTRQDSDGVPQIMLGNEDYVNAALTLYESVFESEICYDPGAGTDERDALFAENKLLFYWIITCQLNRYRSMDTEFGILPMPKLNSEQTKYTGAVNQMFYSAFVVPSFSPDKERTGIVLEVMSGFSVDTVYNTLFETMLGYDSKLLRDNDSKEMLDLVFAGKQYSFDILGLGQVTKCLDMGNWNSFMYQSAYDTYKRSGNAALKRIIQDFEALS